MRLRYRCPQCKRWLQHHWTDREDATGIAIGLLEPIFYIVAFAAAAAGFVFEWWELLVTWAIVGAVAVALIYRLHLRKGRRYYCASCDRVFRGDFLRERTNAPQVTEIAS